MVSWALVFCPCDLFLTLYLLPPILYVSGILNSERIEGLSCDLLRKGFLFFVAGDRKSSVCHLISHQFFFPSIFYSVIRGKGIFLKDHSRPLPHVAEVLLWFSSSVGCWMTATQASSVCPLSLPPLLKSYPYFHPPAFSLFLLSNFSLPPYLPPFIRLTWGCLFLGILSK